jgi:hypothetical protein
MKDEKVMNLPDQEFYKLAKSQCEKYPDLLLIRTEKEIIADFYDYYDRKLPR